MGVAPGARECAVGWSWMADELVKQRRKVSYCEQLHFSCTRVHCALGSARGACPLHLPGLPFLLYRACAGGLPGLAAASHTSTDEVGSEVRDRARAEIAAHILEGGLRGGAAGGDEDIEVAEGVDEALAEFAVGVLEVGVRGDRGDGSRSPRVAPRSRMRAASGESPAPAVAAMRAKSSTIWLCSAAMICCSTGMRCLTFSSSAWAMTTATTAFWLVSSGRTSRMSVERTPSIMSPALGLVYMVRPPAGPWRPRTWGS